MFARYLIRGQLLKTKFVPQGTNFSFKSRLYFGKSYIVPENKQNKLQTHSPFVKTIENHGGVEGVLIYLKCLSKQLNIEMKLPRKGSNHKAHTIYDIEKRIRSNTNDKVEQSARQTS